MWAMKSDSGEWLSRQEMVFQRMEQFHRQRIEQLAKDRGESTKQDAGTLVLHMISQESVERRIRLTAAELKSHGRGIRPLGENHCGHERFNADGFRHEGSTAYSQLFRDGRLEAIMRNVTINDNGANAIRIGACEQALLKIVSAYLTFCKNVELKAPVGFSRHYLVAIRLACVLIHTGPTILNSRLSVPPCFCPNWK